MLLTSTLCACPIAGFLDSDDLSAKKSYSRQLSSANPRVDVIVRTVIRVPDIGSPENIDLILADFWIDASLSGEDASEDIAARILLQKTDSAATGWTGEAEVGGTAFGEVGVVFLNHFDCVPTPEGVVCTNDESVRMELVAGDIADIRLSVRANATVAIAEEFEGVPASMALEFVEPN